MNTRIQKTEKLVQKLLGTQKRGDGSSNADHAHRVRALLLSALTQSREAPKGEALIAITCAALGHDLLEDSQINESTITALAGTKGLGYIKELTNTWGDSQHIPYVRQMTNASEEARLIKYADLTDNLFHASYQARSLGRKWMNTYFLPIVDPMRKALYKTTFKRYKKTGVLLRMSADLARAHLEENIRL